MKAQFRPVFNEERKDLYKILPLDTPMAFGIAVSQACNIHCQYCLHSLSNKELSEKNFEQKNMEWEVFATILDQLKDFPDKIKSISMAGQGEPLCNPRFSDMVKAVKAANVSDEVSTITNALLLDKERVESIIDAGLDRMFISLQGMSAEKYKEVCGADIDFDKFVETLTYLHSYSREKCKINIKIADIALEAGDKEKFLQTFGNICDRIHIETIKPLYADVDYENMLGHNVSDMTTTRFGRLHKKQKACYLSFYGMAVKANGEICPCGAPFQSCELGNIFDTTLVKSWNSKERKKFLLDMLKGKRFENPVCKDCDYPNDVPSTHDEIDPHIDVLMEKFK